MITLPSRFAGQLPTPTLERRIADASFFCAVGEFDRPVRSIAGVPPRQALARETIPHALSSQPTREMDPQNRRSTSSRPVPC